MRRGSHPTMHGIACIDRLALRRIAAPEQKHDHASCSKICLVSRICG